LALRWKLDSVEKVSVAARASSRRGRHHLSLGEGGASALFIAFAAACDSPYGEVTPPRDDASVDAASDAPALSDASADADAQPVNCTADAPFEKPTPIPELAAPGASENAIAFTSDETTALFVRKPTDTTPAQIWKTTVSGAGSFTPPVPLSILGFAPAPNSPVVIGLGAANDRLYLSYFIGSQVGDGNIYVAAGDVANGFGAPTKLSSAINTAANEANPSEVAGELFFDSDDPLEDGGPRRLSLYSALLDGGSRSRLRSDGDGGLNGPSGIDVRPVASRDRLTLFFASRTTGSLDIWAAHRETPSGTFSPPKLVSEVSSPDHEVPLYLTRDGCRLYIARDDATAVARIWVAKRQGSP
jgi:hypothetical protein